MTLTELDRAQMKQDIAQGFFSDEAAWKRAHNVGGTRQLPNATSTQQTNGLSSAFTSGDGGLGNFGYYTTAEGVTTGLDENAFGRMVGTEHGGTLSTTNPNASKTDWGMQGYGGLALGAGQLGLGLASYFDQRGVAKKQKELLGQQVANNRTEMAARANYRDALAKNF